MNFALSPEQEMLRASAREFLAARVPSAVVRRVMEEDRGFDDALWREMAQLGWLGMQIPAAHGGAGFSMLELGVLFEEMGRALTPAPLLSSVLLGANALLIAGTDEQKNAVLPPVAAGETRLALAAIEPAGSWDPAEVATTATDKEGEVVLDGTKSFVIDGHTADTLIVAAADQEGEIDLFMVDADAPGVTAERIETMDMTRKQASVVFDAVRIPSSARLGERGTGADTLARLYDLAAVALAFEQVGGATRCLEMSVEYAKVRIQFGRPIGSFQAVKHKCADMLVAVEGARSCAYYAGWAASVDDADLPVVAALAKAYCSDAYFDVAAETIQVHGGIGFTWEHDAHLYFKRAKTDQLLFGDSTLWRAKLADRIGL